MVISVVREINFSSSYIEFINTDFRGFFRNVPVKIILFFFIVTNYDALFI